MDNAPNNGTANQGGSKMKNVVNNLIGSGCTQGDVEGKAQRIPVECLECGKEFKTISMLPSCPKCGGSDIDLSDPCPGWSSK